MKKYVEFSLRFNRRNKLDKNGKGLIEVRMYHNGKATNHSTGILVMPKEWNFDKGIPKDNGIKRKCDTLIQDLQEFESNFRVKNGSFSLADFQLLNVPEIRLDVKRDSFTKYYVEQLELEKSKRQVSWRSRELTLEYFKKFIPDVGFNEMNSLLIRRFEYFLHDKKLHVNTIAKHHKHLKRYINLAIDDHHILPQNNPYKKHDIVKADSKSQFCTEEELERLEELTFAYNEKMLERCRDMFLFGCYTGLRFGDIYKLKAKHFHHSSEGLTLEYQANKTRKFGVKYLYLLFAGKPEKIALKYMPETENALFKGLTNPKVNLNLKTLAKKANINKPLCFKDSRNTFASILATKVSIDVIQDELQHHKQQTSVDYIKGFNKKRALEGLEWGKKK